jgi:hypothetical protein
MDLTYYVILVVIKEMVVKISFVFHFFQNAFMCYLKGNIYYITYGSITVYCNYRKNFYCWSAVKIHFQKYTNTSALTLESSMGNLDNCPA